ncbi:MAG: HEPN domain-containing protein [Bacteroidetes bacterium]|nr:HEPN domain-containing protein [Bacteroidota bacterium]MBU1679192.1 HEPN domain-containing protein [Bacteroidota bacterium]
MNITPEVMKLIEKTDHALEVAEILFEQGYSSDSASKVYYAMFYAAQALLKSEEIEVIKHSAVESALGYYFAKPGRLDSKYHKMFINARKIREIADYDIQEEIVEPVANLKLEEGREFISVIRKMLGMD